MEKRAVLIAGGESLLAYWHHPNFQFAVGDICEPGTIQAQGQAQHFDIITHLAALVYFPACQAVGKDVAWLYNTQVVKRVFGVWPHTRFDLIINQFVLEAVIKHRWLIYRRGCARSLVHVRDIGEAILATLAAPLLKAGGLVFNAGSDDGIFRLPARDQQGNSVIYGEVNG